MPSPPQISQPLASADAERTRLSILSAATEVFIEKGFAGSSLSVIAKAAGVTKSLIHHHFGSKQGLWDQVKLTAFTDYTEQQRQLLNSREPSLELLEDSMRIYFRFLQQSPGFARLISWMSIEEDTTCTTMNDELILLGVQRIAEGQQRGLIRDDIEARFILVNFFSLVRYWFVGSKVLPGDAPHQLDPALGEAYLENTIRVFIDGIRPRETSA